MTLGKAICNVHQLFIGSLGKYGYDKLIYDCDGDLGLPTDFDVKSQEVLDDDIVAALLLQGSLTHDTDGSVASKKVEELKQKLEKEEIESETDPQEEQTSTESKEEVEEEQTNTEGQTFEDHVQDEIQLDSAPIGQPNPEPKEEETSEDSTDSEEESDSLESTEESDFDKINGLSWQSGKVEVAELTDLDLLTRLSEEAKYDAVKKAAADRLEELTNPETEQ